MKLSSSIKTTEITPFGKALVSLYAARESLSSDSHLKIVMEEIASLSESLVEAVNRGSESMSLESVDAERDRLVKNLGAILAGYAAMPFEEECLFAQSLLSVYDKYGVKIIYKPNAEESTYIDSMLKDYDDEKYAQGIEALRGVKETLSLLKEAESAFKKANQNLVTKTAEKNSSGKKSATELKKMLVACVNEKLLPYLSAIRLVSPEAYSAFVQEVEVEVTRANKAVSARSKKSGEQAPASESEA